MNDQTLQDYVNKQLEKSEPWEVYERLLEAKYSEAEIKELLPDYDADAAAAEETRAQPNNKGVIETIGDTWFSNIIEDIGYATMDGIKALLPVEFHEEGLQGWKPKKAAWPPILAALADTNLSLFISDVMSGVDPEDIEKRNPLATTLINGMRTAFGTAAAGEKIEEMVSGEAKTGTTHRDEFKRAWTENPGEQLLNILPAIRHLAKASGSAKMAKTAKAIEKFEDYTEGLGTTMASKIPKFGRSRFAKDPDLYNPTVESTYGETPTGESLTSEKTVAQLADEIGAGVDQTPAAALTDSQFAGHVEEVGRNIGENNKFEQRFKNTAEAIKAKQDAMLEEMSTKSIDAPDNIKNAENAGNQVLTDYQERMQGLKSETGKKLDENKAVMRQPIRTVDLSDAESLARKTLEGFTQQLFPNTVAEIERLIAEDSGVRGNLNDKQLATIIDNMESLFDGIKKKADTGQITLQDVKQLRTAFHRNMDAFKNANQITEVGSGSAVDVFKRTLFKDLYDLIEKEVEANPANFPENFDAAVKLANQEYAELIQLDQTPAAKYLRRNQHKPVLIVDNLLSKNKTVTTEFIADMKRLIGEEGWSRLRPALLNRIFEKSLKNATEENPITEKGLKNVLDTITEGNPNRLIELFDEETAKTLTEMANFSQRTFARRGKWNTPYANYITKLLESPSFPDIAASTLFFGPELTQLVDSIARKSGYSLGNDLGTYLLISGVVYMGTKARRWGLMSDLGRKWMLEGISKNVKIFGKDVTFDGQTFYKVGEFMQEHAGEIGYAARQVTKAKGESDKDKKKQKPIIPARRNQLNFRTTEPVE